MPGGTRGARGKTEMAQGRERDGTERERRAGIHRVFCWTNLLIADLSCSLRYGIDKPLRVHVLATEADPCLPEK